MLYYPLPFFDGHGWLVGFSLSYLAADLKPPESQNRKSGLGPRYTDS